MSALERLNGQLRGTGDRAMVFAHGFGCDQRMWRHVAPHFETEFVTVLIDLVGSGRSDHTAYSADKYSTLKGYALDIVELGHEVPLDNAIFVGHSCGAMIGLLASIEAPQMFESLVMLSASPRYIDDEDYVGGFTKKDVLMMLRRLRSDYAGWSEDMAPLFMGNRTRPELTDELLQSFRQTDPEIAAKFATAIFTSDWRRELPKVTASCLIVQSEADPVVPVSVGRYLDSQIANGHFETLATEGHFPHLSAPDRVIASIRQFVGVQPLHNGGNGIHSRANGSHDEFDAGSPDLKFTAGAWSRRLPPLADAVGRAQLEELLLQRAGELLAHLGRYDMHARAVEIWLRAKLDEVVPEEDAALRIRGARIRTLLRKLALDELMLLQFEAIDREILAVFSRYDTAAKNIAVVPALKLQPDKLQRHPKEWYEFDVMGDQEMLFFIDRVERDILLVAALCVRLSNFAGSLANCHVGNEPT